MFKDKTILITGGTGSFGQALVRRVIAEDFKKLVVLSRDEKKQEDMRHFFNNPKLQFRIGDVRDIKSVAEAMESVDFVFHAAALKQVPSCEFYPMEAYKTNVIGTENVLDAAIKHGVKKVVCLSTDKAVYPINAMGISKAMMEKVAVAKSRSSQKTVICVTRYGNVLASRGSVVPLFWKQLKSDLPVTITNPEMTRFIMSLDEAVELVCFALKNANPGDIFVQKSPSTDLLSLVKSIAKLFPDKNCEIKEIGTRHGEKLFEVLLSQEEMCVAEDLGNYFKVSPDKRGLNYDMYFVEGKRNTQTIFEYSSHSAPRLSVEDLVEKIKSSRMQSDLLWF